MSPDFLEDASQAMGERRIRITAGIGCVQSNIGHIQSLYEAKYTPGSIASTYKVVGYIATFVLLDVLIAADLR